MIDYDALKALQAVLEFQTFEGAARALRISQSAVTQRIQSFEAYVGEKLLIRKQPLKATPTGENYLNLLRKVMSLENELIFAHQTHHSIKIALNRDTLDLYFLDLLLDQELAQALTFEIIADDQENTLDYLKSGQVDMCISSHKKPLPNHQSIHLGDMYYHLVCSKKFFEKYFQSGVSKQALLRAPLIIFDKHDRVQHTYLREHFGIDSHGRVNQIPSVQSFKKAILGGFGYGMVPKIDIEQELKKGSVIELLPSKSFKIPLYLHQWEYLQPHIKVFNEKLLKVARKL